MKKIIILFLLFALCGCSKSALPLPSIEEGIRGELEIDSNINEKTIDRYLDRNDCVYRDMRMLKDEADFSAIGGDSDLNAYVKGFEIVPYPFLCNIDNLPLEVGEPYSGNTLFVKIDDDYYPKYAESESIIEQLFPKDKNIILMCGGGGYARDTKKLLVYLGYDPNKIYNAGGFWYYEGNNAVNITESPENYHEIDFSALNPINEDIKAPEKENNNETNIIALNTYDDLAKQMNDQDTLLVFAYLPECSTCAAFKPIVEEIAGSKQMPIYSISLMETKTGILDRIFYAPSMAIIKNGNLLAYLEANNNYDKAYYTSAEKLSTWIAEYIPFDIVHGQIENPADIECDENACVLR